MSEREQQEEKAADELRTAIMAIRAGLTPAKLEAHGSTKNAIGLTTQEIARRHSIAEDDVNMLKRRWISRWEKKKAA